MLELNDENFEKEVLESEKPVLVVFWKPGCKACHPLFPLAGEVAEEIEGKAKVGELNILQSSEKAREYKIPAVPTMIIFKDGKAKEKAVGMRPKQVLIDKINSLI